MGSGPHPPHPPGTGRARTGPRRADLHQVEQDPNPPAGEKAKAPLPRVHGALARNPADPEKEREGTPMIISILDRNHLSCRKCGGNIALKTDLHGKYLTCLACGATRNQDLGMEAVQKASHMIMTGAAPG